MSGDAHDRQRLAAILDAHTGAQLVAGLEKVEVATSGGLVLSCERQHERAHLGLIYIANDGPLTSAEVLSVLFAHHREHHADQPFG